MADRLVPLAELAPGERALDVACGSGAVAARAATALGPTRLVVGLDLSPGMLAEARRLDPRGRWCQGDAAALPLRDGSFDAVFCQQGLPFVPDRVGALGEMHRVLAPG